MTLVTSQVFKRNIMSLQLHGTAACKMRDKLTQARIERKITLKEIRDKMSMIELPEWLKTQILEMENYRKYDRVTCPIEQAMAGAVYYHIVKEIVENDKK